jgi:hypothetical protein
MNKTCCESQKFRGGQRPPLNENEIILQKVYSMLKSISWRIVLSFFLSLSVIVSSSM